MKYPRSACTSVMVGKRASLDGSTMIARNDDLFDAIHPKRFLVQPASSEERFYHSNYNGFSMKLPQHRYRYTTTPNTDPSHGINEESGINEKNVCVSATESIYANERVLGYDPYLADGIAEDSIPTILLPTVESARGAVEYLGKLIEQYGSAEGNGVIFSDKDDVWYMEIVTGHHWVAQRIPDDAYAVVANQVAIEEIDFADSEQFLWSTGLLEFIENNHLNPLEGVVNFRKIFGTSTEKDRYYNTPRVWFAQRYLNPEIVQEPTSSEMPFICRSQRKIAMEDVAYILKSHYNETIYDPLNKENVDTGTKFRSIALSRTQNSHILQIRNSVPAAYAAIHWLVLGTPTFNPFVPFYANANDTALSYREETPKTFTLSNAYWLAKALCVVTEGHYSELVQENRDFQDEIQSFAWHKLTAIDSEAGELSGSKLTDYLTACNQAIVDEIETRAKAHLGEMMMNSIGLSKLTYTMDKNL